MSTSNNPFAAPAPQKATSFRGLLVAWSVAGVMVVVVLLLLLQGTQHQARRQRELDVLRTALAQASADLAGATSGRQTNLDLIASLQKQVADLQQERSWAGQLARTLEDEMRAKLESKDVTISQLQGKLTVTIVDRVMFDSGEATLKPDGATVMQKIATLLAAHPEVKIHVIGHTDNVPIRPTAQTRFASNWELSTARALAAVHFLTEKAGVDPRRVGAVGYGEFHPIADNATAEGRARNRRIAITILPDELAVADTVPQPKVPANTNSNSPSSP